MIDTLATAPRLVARAKLEPLAGSTFQPTGFPDLGAATFRRPNGTQGSTRALLVESVQSMTNHFEALGWDGPVRQPRAPIAGLPYVEVIDENRAFLTSSRLEPHRLAAAYVRDAQIDGKGGTEWIGERLGLVPGKPLDWPHIYKALFELDPLCLLHGVFFSDKKWHGNPKVRRALTAVIEAHDIEEVVSGGLKRDDVQFKSDTKGGRGAEEGYGFVPFGRTEYVAGSIELTAVVDLEQIRGYGLDDKATRLLTLIALWELQGLLAQPLRLRTACDLTVVDVAVGRPQDFSLPTTDELVEAIEKATPNFEQPGARQMTWTPSKQKAAKVEREVAEVAS
jgi:CRISPR-associated protein Csb1